MLLDAFGTLVTLDPPAPRLRRALAEEGHAHDLAACERAMSAEIAHYRRHHLRGSDAESLAGLREECASIVAAALGPDTPDPRRMTEILMASLRFRARAGARAALDALGASGARVAVVSNWDVSLADTLRALDLARGVDAVITSAAVGRAKPHPAPFHAALRAIGAPAAAALHCGDRPDEDVAGARAAGVRPVLLAEGADDPDDGVTRISSLAELASLARGAP